MPVEHQPTTYDQTRRFISIQILTVLAVGLIISFRPAWKEETVVFETFEVLGFLGLFVCVLGRLWSILYSGNRKNRELVTSGPYSVTRNPLYLFSVVGAFSIGLLFGSVVLSILVGGGTLVVFWQVAKGEARHLRQLFGTAYDAYAAVTPLFWPDFRLYREAPSPVFSPSALRRTVMDTAWFLVAIPAVELIEFLRNVGVMPDLFPLA